MTACSLQLELCCDLGIVARGCAYTLRHIQSDTMERRVSKVKRESDDQRVREKKKWNATAGELVRERADHFIQTNAADGPNLHAYGDGYSEDSCIGTRRG